MNKFFIVIFFAVRTKILNHESGTHNFVHSIEVRGTRAHEAGYNKKYMMKVYLCNLRK